MINYGTNRWSSGLQEEIATFIGNYIRYYRTTPTLHDLIGEVGFRKVVLAFPYVVLLMNGGILRPFNFFERPRFALLTDRRYRR